MSTGVKSKVMDFHLIHEVVSHLSEDLKHRVTQVATNAQVQNVLVKGYEAYLLTFIYPAKPLWALYTPFVAAANFFMPKTLGSLTKGLPTWLKSCFVFKVTKKQLVLESAMATLFLGIMAGVPPVYRIPCSLLLMGLLPYFVRESQDARAKKDN